MSRRYTDTEKWKRPWFRTLSPYHKLLFTYLNDNCDAAGFLEYDPDRIEFETKIPGDQDYKALFEGLKQVYVREGWVWMSDHVIYQQPQGLAENNRAHRPIYAAIREHAALFPEALSLIGEEQPEAEKPARRTRRRKCVADNPPTLEEFKAYCKKHGYEHVAERAYRYYAENAWMDGKDDPVRNWKQKLLGVWFNDKNAAPASAPQRETKRTYDRLEDVTK